MVHLNYFQVLMEVLKKMNNFVLTLLFIGAFFKFVSAVCGVIALKDRLNEKDNT